MATFTDDFNRADENPLASPWVVCVGAGLNASNPKIVSNQYSGGVGATMAVLGNESFDNDQSASVNVISGNTTNYFGPAVRANTSGDCYFVGWQVNQSRFQVAKRINGVVTEFANIGNTGFLSGDKLTLSVAGNVLTVLINDVVYGTYTDTDNSLTSGVTGIYAQGDITRFDNFSADGLIVAATPSITNVDTDNILVDGQQTIPLVTSGFSPDLNALSLRVGSDTLALTGLAGTGDNYTFNLNDITSYTEDTAGLPLSSAAYQNEIVATNGTDTATINITRNPKAGYTVVETVSAVSTKGSLFENRVGGAPADGSQMYMPAGVNVTSAGIITITDPNITEFTAHVWDVTIKNWEVVTFNADSGGSSTYPKSITRPIVSGIVKSIINA